MGLSYKNSKHLVGYLPYGHEKHVIYSNLDKTNAMKKY